MDDPSEQRNPHQNKWRLVVKPIHAFTFEHSFTQAAGQFDSV